MEYILLAIWCPLFVGQIILVFIFGKYNESGLDVFLYIGWIVWGFSVVLGWWPILIFKRKGGVRRGESYVRTTVLVDTGLYSIIRHPQYTAGILFSLALVLVSQDWLVLIMGAVVMPSLYGDILMADKHEIEKFGDEYRRYMKKVPRTNFLLGIIKLLIRRKKEN